MALVRTQQKKIPWSWIFLMLLPVSTISFALQINFAAFPLSIYEFTDSATAVSILTALNMYFGFLVSPYVSWKSDRIWTRIGRRKPYILLGFVGMAIGMSFAPIAPSLLLLTLSIVFFSVSYDLGTWAVVDPLINEVIPSPQRANGNAVKNVLDSIMYLIFNLVLLGQYDNVYVFNFGGSEFLLTGDKVLYWVSALAVLGAAVYFAWGVEEERPKYRLPPETFRPFSFLKEMALDYQSRMIYLLMFGQIVLVLGLQALSVLMVTQQFGYSTQEFGWIQSLTWFLRLFFIPVAAFVANRYSHLKVYICGLSLSTLYPVGYWAFIHFVAPNNIPAFGVIVAFEVFNTLVDLLGQIASAPMIFDYAPREKMGTVYAGISLLRSIIKMAMLTVMGPLVDIYSRYFPMNGGKDYSVALLYLFVLSLIGLIGLLYFAKEVKKGRLVPVGHTDALFDDDESSETKEE